MITMWLYQLCKYSVGRLRPHFLDVCQPDTTDCVANTYVDTYVCLGTDAKKLKDARLSFFSGHCATSFYYATFIIVSVLPGDRLLAGFRSVPIFD